MCTMNQALLVKWWWLLITKPSGSLEQILKEKYGPHSGSWTAKPRNRTNATLALWKDMIRVGNMFWNSIYSRVGRESKVAFWREWWCSMHTIFDMLRTGMPWLGDKKMETSPYEGCETRKDFLIK